MRPFLLIAVLLLAGCGHGSDATGPDTVPEAERRDHLQTAKERSEEPRSITPMTIPAIIALPTFPRAYSRGDLVQIESLESRGVVTIGYVARIRRMDDGDYHVQVTEAPVGRCLDHDTPDQLITEVTPVVQERHSAYTLAALRSLCGTDTELRLTGWLLYDSPHKGDAGRSTPWEIHPVDRIEVCCWRDLS